MVSVNLLSTTVATNFGLRCSTSTDGTNYTLQQQEFSSGNTFSTFTPILLNVLVTMAASSYIRIEFQNNSTTAWSLSSDATTSWVSIYRVG